MTAEIKKIVLRVGEKELELSVGEAQDLHTSLNQFFRNPQSWEGVPRYPSYTITTSPGSSFIERPKVVCCE